MATMKNFDYCNVFLNMKYFKPIYPFMIDKNVDTPPTVENLYKEGYLTEHVKTAKGKEYTITYEAVSGGTAKAVVVTAPSVP